MQHWHIITPEFPPMTGGVADYSSLVARGLTEAGDQVDVWCPRIDLGGESDPEWVHRELGTFGIRDLKHLTRRLKEYPGPHRLLVQWVPHGYGWRTMNVAFCSWLLATSLRGAEVDLIVHEPFLSFWEGTFRQDLAAAVHRLMAILILKAARRVWLTTPSWEKMLQPYTMGRSLEFQWLPVPSNIPVHSGPLEISKSQERATAEGTKVLGHFGSYGRGIADLLWQILPRVLQHDAGRTMVLMGRGSHEFRAEMVAKHPWMESRLVATGRLGPEELSDRLSSCDVVLQPYPDGVTTRRSSIMAALQHGIPAVTTIGRLSEELWSDCGAVAIAPSVRPDEFVKVTEALIGDPFEMAKLKAAACLFYHHYFDLPRTIQRLRADVSVAGHQSPADVRGSGSII